MNNISNLLLERRTMLEGARKQLLASLKNAPPGTLRVHSKLPHPQYYHFISQTDLSSLPKKITNHFQYNPRGNYIPKRDRDIARQLAQKDYDQLLLEAIEHELSALSHMIEDYSEFSDPDLYLSVTSSLSPPRQELITPYFISDEEYAAQWLAQPYEHKEIDPANQVIYTDRGEQVRSRAEKMIANQLNALGIPYKYECPLSLHGYRTIFPDFTLLNIHTRKEAILEHFGLMTDPDYAAKALKKLDLYAHNGYFIGDQLFITYETEEFAFDDRLLASMLKDFLP